MNPFRLAKILKYKQQQKAAQRSEEDQNVERELTLMGHLDELRYRLIICVVALFIGILAGLYFADPVLKLLIQPVKSLHDKEARTQSARTLRMTLHEDGRFRLSPGESLAAKQDMIKTMRITFPASGDGATTRTLTVGDRDDMIYTKPLDPVMMLFKVAIVLGILMSLMVWLWQVWLFIAPGLTANEKKVVKPMLMGGIVLFPLGALFAYAMMYMVIQIMETYVVAGIDRMYAIADYLKLVTTMMIVFGLIFELPLVVALMARVGIVTPGFLTEYRRHIYVGLAGLSMVLTPADPFTMIIALIPLIILFELSVWIARFMELLRGRDADEDTAEESPA